MTGAPALAYPGSRSLAGWWRQLAPLQPHALWVGHLFLHRVEALVRVRQLRRLDQFTLLVLETLAQHAAEKLDRIDERLHLGAQLLRQVLRGLATNGLAAPDVASCWETTAKGRAALQDQDYPHIEQRRQVFYFLDREGPEGRPHYLNLTQDAGVSWTPTADWAFDVSHLEACVGRSVAWKQQHGFPLEVEGVIRQPAEGQSRPGKGQVDQPAGSAGGYGPEISEWQQVVFDQPIRLFAALVSTSGADGGKRLLGFAVRQEGWALQAAQPVFSLAADWPEVFPGLAKEPALPKWRQAWRTWCQQRGLAPADAHACRLEKQGYQLRVTPAFSLLERLRAMRSDALKSEAWILAGQNHIRPAALIEILGGDAPAAGARR